MARIEWGRDEDDSLQTLRFTLSNGVKSPIFGSSSRLDHSYLFKQKIGSVAVFQDDESGIINTIKFQDRQGGELLQIKGKSDVINSSGGSTEVTSSLRQVRMGENELLVGLQVAIFNTEKSIIGLKFLIVSYDE